MRAARRPLTALAAPVSLLSGPAGAGRGDWSAGDGADAGVDVSVGAGAAMGIDESGPVERVSDGETADGAAAAGAAGGAANGEGGVAMAPGGVPNGTCPESGMPRLTGPVAAPVVPVRPVVPASASGAARGGRRLELRGRRRDGLGELLLSGSGRLERRELLEWLGLRERRGRLDRGRLLVVRGRRRLGELRGCGQPAGLRRGVL